jgi:hypothetical protein
MHRSGDLRGWRVRVPRGTVLLRERSERGVRQHAEQSGELRPLRHGVSCRAVVCGGCVHGVRSARAGVLRDRNVWRRGDLLRGNLRMSERADELRRRVHQHRDGRRPLRVVLDGLFGYCERIAFVRCRRLPRQLCE